MPNKPPAITGKQLIRLLMRDGWEHHGRRTHGVALVKTDPDGRRRRTIVPDKNSELPEGTLAAILSARQSGIGRERLLALIEQYGLK